MLARKNHIKHKKHKRQKQQKKKQSNNKSTYLSLVPTQKKPSIAKHTSTGNISTLLETATRVGTLTTAATVAVQVNAMALNVIEKVFSLVDPSGRSYLVNCFSDCATFAEIMFLKGFDVLQRNTTLSNITRLVGNVTCGWPRVSVLQEGNENFTQYGIDLISTLNAREANCEYTDRVIEDFMIGDWAFLGICFLAGLGFFIKYCCFNNSVPNQSEYQSVRTNEVSENETRVLSFPASHFQRADRNNNQDITENNEANSNLTTIELGSARP